MRRLFTLLLTAPLVGCAVSTAPSEHDAKTGPRILAVVAHPDDETAFAAALYAAATFLDAACDVVVVTNGEGGFKYASAAEPIYGLELTHESVGRAELPDIRRGEMRSACALLGVRELRFLDQPDHRYTTDEREVLAEGAGVWDLALVRARLADVLAAGRYDFAFCMLPSQETHGHHKAATILLLRAVEALPAGARPVVLGAMVEGEDGRVNPEPGGLDGWPVTRLRPAAERQVFDRRRPFGYRDRLDWRIVVDWVIAEHKSQGTLQMMAGQGAREVFFTFDVGPENAPERAVALFAELAEVSFPAREYGPSAGIGTTPAGSR